MLTVSSDRRGLFPAGQARRLVQAIFYYVLLCSLSPQFPTKFLSLRQIHVEMQTHSWDFSMKRLKPPSEKPCEQGSGLIFFSPQTPAVNGGPKMNKGP
jgi:hypothetical protein